MWLSAEVSAPLNGRTLNLTLREPVASDGERLGQEMRSIFEASSKFGDPEHIRTQMAYRHMVGLADVLEGWALDRRMTPHQTARIAGWAEALRQLAAEVGPNWNPPTPPRMSLFGFLGRKVLDE